jgi:hypothetical protein
MSKKTHCPLCGGNGISPYCSDHRRPYVQCATCKLVFVPPDWHLTPDAENAEYHLHQNDPNESGYRLFLSRLLHPLVERISPGARGMDFGCGPGPALAQMLRDAGFEVALYDPVFAPDENALIESYDFITATEVVEHLRRPGWELDRLWALLTAQGWLGIMTKLVRDPTAFASWHYKNDPTHICFSSVDTWHWWAGASLEIIGADVILLQRPA